MMYRYDLRSYRRGWGGAVLRYLECAHTIYLQQIDRCIDGIGQRSMRDVCVKVMSDFCYLLGFLALEPTMCRVRWAGHDHRRPATSDTQGTSSDVWNMVNDNAPFPKPCHVGNPRKILCDVVCQDKKAYMYATQPCLPPGPPPTSLPKSKKAKVCNPNMMSPSLCMYAKDDTTQCGSKKQKNMCSKNLPVIPAFCAVNCTIYSVEVHLFCTSLSGLGG